MGTTKRVPAKIFNGTDWDALNFESDGDNQGLYRQAIINGNFDVWQRGTSFANPTSYTADRWGVTFDGSMSRTISQQYVSNIGGDNLIHRVLQSSVASASGQGYSAITQKIDEITKFYGDWTISFWVYSSVAYSLTTRVDQYFGSGGSATAYGNVVTFPIAANTWTKVTATFNIASCVGKTFGVNHCLLLHIFMPINVVHTLQLSQVQLNVGKTALPFSTKSFDEELSNCQRYYQRSYGTDESTGMVNGLGMLNGIAMDTQTVVFSGVPFYQEMRATPSVICYTQSDGTGGANARFTHWLTGNKISGTSAPVIHATRKQIRGISVPGSSLLAGQAYTICYTADAEL